MADETQTQPGGSKWGRAWIFVAPIGLWRIGRETVQSVRDTFVRSSATVRSIAQEHQPTQSDWNGTIAALGVTYSRIAREVRRRQAMAILAALFVGLGIYGLVVWRAPLPGLGCAGLAALYYCQSVLRLHQIRHHEFISFVGYLARARRKPREFLPLGLPAGWKLFIGKSS